MSILYERINNLCLEKGVTGYRLCREIGASPSMMTELRTGRRDGVSAVTAAKIAAYFGVSVEYLLGSSDNREETKKAPTDKGERDDDRISMLIDLFQKLPEADQNDVIYQLLKKAQSQLIPDDQK